MLYSLRRASPSQNTVFLVDSRYLFSRIEVSILFDLVSFLLVIVLSIQMGTSYICSCRTKLTNQEITLPQHGYSGPRLFNDLTITSPPLCYIRFLYFLVLCFQSSISEQMLYSLRRASPSQNTVFLVDSRYPFSRIGVSILFDLVSQESNLGENLSLTDLYCLMYTSQELPSSSFLLFSSLLIELDIIHLAGLCSQITTTNALSSTPFYGTSKPSLTSPSKLEGIRTLIYPLLKGSLYQ